MANFAPLDPKTSANDAVSPKNAQPVEVPMEEKLRLFWENNSRAIFGLCVVALLAILLRGAYGYFQREREAGIERDFAAAITPEKLKSFIDQHSDHSLAGVASLQLADQAYSGGKYSEAAADYRQAADILKKGPFAGRARIGAAVSKISLGDHSGEEDLRQLAHDSAQPKVVQGEAAFHLASLAIEAGQMADAAKDLELASSADPSGIWSQRALLLRATLPASAVGDVSPAAKLPAKP
jgi:tetratricopeptide (TPR) repeat protein